MGTPEPRLLDARGPSGTARERILGAAYELFARRGVQGVGIDAIVERSGVARQTLYRHFASKQDLVLAFLERRRQVWIREWLQAEVERRAASAEDRLLAVFDVFDAWFRSAEFEGCSFINVLLELSDPADPLHCAAGRYLAEIRQFLEQLAGDAGLADPEDFARKWHILMKGAIVSAGEGDRAAAQRARQMGTLVLRAQQRSQG